jgi:SAM-dependent methyltransferase
LIEQLYGIQTPHLLDLDQFEVPFDGTFDLIIANHIFTHAVRPGLLFQRVRERLTPGGHLYLYNEGEDTEFLKEGKSMINTLNPFHLQAFDGATLSRAFAAAGFETVYRHRDMCLLKPAEPVAQQMSPDERANRLRLYLTARDTAILRLPESQRGRYEGEWTAAIERAVAAGLARIDDKGRLRLSLKGSERADA